MIKAFHVSLDFGAELWVGYTLDLKRSSFAFLFYFIFSERGSQHFFFMVWLILLHPTLIFNPQAGINFGLCIKLSFSYPQPMKYCLSKYFLYIYFLSIDTWKTLWAPSKCGGKASWYAKLPTHSRIKNGPMNLGLSFPAEPKRITPLVGDILR